MTTQSQRETARIYTFPARGRFAHEGETVRATREQPAPTVMGSGWYHDEAIREEQTTKN